MTNNSNQMPSDEELRALEREEMESMQASYGHNYTSPYHPQEDEAEIAIRHAKDVIQECRIEVLS